MDPASVDLPCRERITNCSVSYIKKTADLDMKCYESGSRAKKKCHDQSRNGVDPDSVDLPCRERITNCSVTCRTV